MANIPIKRIDHRICSGARNGRRRSDEYLKRSGSFFLNVGATHLNPMLPHELVCASSVRCVRPAKHESTGSNRSPSRKPEEFFGGWRSHGHFKPIKSPRFLNDCHEYIFHFTQDGNVEIDRLALGVPYQDKSNISRRGHTRGRDLRCRGNTWFIPYETIQSRERERPHPATFPVQLAEWCIKLHGVSRVSRRCSIRFSASAIQPWLRRNCDVKRFIGFEIDETYLAEAKRRLRSTSSRSGASVH